MTSRDDRFLLRRQNIEKARAANKITRATLQIRKWIIHERYVRQQKPRDYNLPVSATNLLITVAFNDSWLIKLQSRALRQFLNDDYHLVVVDNSPDIEKSSEIRDAAGVEGYTRSRSQESLLVAGSQPFPFFGSGLGLEKHCEAY